MRPRGTALTHSFVSLVLLASACDSQSEPVSPASGGSGGSSAGTGALGGASDGSAATAGSVAGASGVGASGVGAGNAGSAFGGAASGAAGSTTGGAGASGSAGNSAGTGGAGGAGAGGAPVAGSAGIAGSAGAAGDREDGGEGGEGGASERVVLFDGESLAEWRPINGNGDAPWELAGDAMLVVAPGSGNLVSRRTFEDVFVHVEYKTPALAANVTGQDRGNSGVYLHSMYELQVLDSFGLPPAINGCGAIYGVSAPSSSACYEQEVWNTYEIEFRAARFDEQDRKLEPARVLSAHLNGVLVQDDVAVPNSTEAGEPEAPGPAPLMLQDHGNRVAFRNIWVIPR